jgi:hypothetical protein
MPEHMPESSIEILGHPVGGITYRHYVHHDPLAFKAIIALPQPPAFRALVNGFEPSLVTHPEKPPL